MVNGAPPKDPAPQIATGTVEILQQVLAQNQELTQLISSKDEKGGSKNNNRLPTPSTRPSQVQPRNPMPTYFGKYFWTHGRGIHKGSNCNSKNPVHKEKTKMETNMDGSNYRCKELQCGTVLKAAKNNDRDILLKSIDSTLVPPTLMQ